jgi:hypothetical protein
MNMILNRQGAKDAEKSAFWMEENLASLASWRLISFYAGLAGPHA